MSEFVTNDSVGAHMNNFRSLASVAALTLLAGAANAATYTYDLSNAKSDPTVNSGNNDHSIFFNGSIYSFSSGSFVYDDVTGEASLTGIAYDSGGSDGFSVALEFDETAWGDGVTTFPTPKLEFQTTSDYTDNGIDPVNDWTAFILDETTSIMTVIGDVTVGGGTFSNGDVLDVFSKPTSGTYTFQFGEGANGKNTNVGLSGWFGFTHNSTTYCGAGNVCDFNIDLALDSVTQPPLVPLPAPAFLLIGGLAALGAVRRYA